jgi:polysaccharide deacetylase family protein (PEP-CTERM system associated)
MGKIVNAMTIDVEDYCHVSAFSKSIDRNEWDRYESRVERNTKILLAIFEEHGISATFFVLGWVAERYPDLVNDISIAGHEVACHGYSHELIYNQTPGRFREETIRAKKIIEDIVQKPVIGYRAASFSINKDSEWAVEILIEAGFKYDSSVFPVRHDRYGVSNSPRFPYRIGSDSGHDLAEYPMTTIRVFGNNLPVSGGGYFRLYPYWFTRLALSSVNRMEQQPFVFYLHPWEIDPEQPRINAGWFSKFRHYNNLSRCRSRLERLINDFEFGTVSSALNELKLL